MVRRARLLLCLSLAAPVLAMAQQWPLTRAERTNFNETSHYADVVEFLNALQRIGAPVSVQTIGKSFEGREIPLAIASYPPVATPAEARRLGRPIVFIQGNIHAGEVEGKEAALILLRRLSQEGPKGLLSKLVLLVAPIYNIDGNEKFGPVARNRPEQDGPALVGVRPNGQGLDLNRDAIKAESPEMEALLRHVYNTWDPDVMMDLHTTNGTRHGWELTYSPPLNPNTYPDIMRLARDVIVPEVRARMARQGLPVFDYGNAEKRGEQTAWYTYGHEGRYCTNYVGLRNRIAILSEATTYIPFKDRVKVTDRFVTEVLTSVAGRAKQVLDATRGADARVVEWGLDPNKAPQLGVRFEFASRGVDTVLLEKRPQNGATTRPKEIERVRMPIYDRFRVTRTAKFPAAYLIPASERNTVALLREHGVVVEQLLEPWSGSSEQFTITAARIAQRPFQGHRLIELDGTFGIDRTGAESGSYLVRTAQPLGVLAFHILEPESTDGAAAWGFLGESFVPDQRFPIRKVFSAVRAATRRVD